MKIKGMICIHNRERMRWIILFLLIILTCILIGAIVCDCSIPLRSASYSLIRDVSYKTWYKVFFLRYHFKYIAIQILENLNSIVVTYNTVLMAIVIFFYSISDNKKLGIPHRTIIKYSIGSDSLPIMVIYALIVVPIASCAIKTGYYMFTLAGFCVVFVLQLFITCEIFSCTSLKHAYKVIRKKEWTLYHLLYNNKYHNKEILFELNHLEYIIESDESIFDKAPAIYNILDVPFYHQDKSRKRKSTLPEENFSYIYRYYYKKTFTIFSQYLCNQDTWKRSEIYTILYHFIGNVLDWHDDVRECQQHKEEKSRLDDICMIVISGILNSVYASGVADKEAFCNQVFNQYLINSDIYLRQIKLYMLYHGLAGLYEEKYTLPENIADINRIKEAFLTKADYNFYLKHWECWITIYNVSEKEQRFHFKNAINTLTRQCNISVPIMNILARIANEKGIKYENTSIAIDE